VSEIAALWYGSSGQAVRPFAFALAQKLITRAGEMIEWPDLAEASIDQQLRRAQEELGALVRPGEARLWQRSLVGFAKACA
jgi:hypothetical protein